MFITSITSRAQDPQRRGQWGRGQVGAGVSPAVSRWWQCRGGAGRLAHSLHLAHLAPLAPSRAARPLALVVTCIFTRRENLLSGVSPGTWFPFRKLASYQLTTAAYTACRCATHKGPGTRGPSASLSATLTHGPFPPGPRMAAGAPALMPLSQAGGKEVRGAERCPPSF